MNLPINEPATTTTGTGANKMPNDAGLGAWTVTRRALRATSTLHTACTIRVRT